jgi:antitoxin component HigA of HigAB toxin-antitoxin module
VAASIFQPIRSEVVAWEKIHEAPSFQDTPRHITLKYLMQEHTISQYQLEKEGIANQSLLSKIFLGKCSISKGVTKKLAQRFHVSPMVFL